MLKSLVPLRPFGQTVRQQERKYRGGLSYHHKDFTKNESFKDHMKRRVLFFKARVPLIPLSRMANAEPRTVSRKRRPYMVTSATADPKIMKHANQALQRQATHSVEDIWQKEGASLRDKYFVLDHTAEVLENYRRIQENEIFDRVLFEEREKKAFLKKEARKIDNLIDNYEQRFANYKYFQGTDAATIDLARIHPSKDLFLEDNTISKNVASNNQIKPQPTSEQTLLNPHKDYLSKNKQLSNRRIDQLLTPRSNNPSL